MKGLNALAGGDTTVARPVSAPRLSLADRSLPLWIAAAIALGLGLGRVFPGASELLDRVRFVDVSLPVGIGLFWMMYPVLARVRYGRMTEFTGQPRLMAVSFALNWVVGPLLMFTLAWLLLPDHPEYRNGVILIGLARCIAMVLVWNMLACGDGELAALLVALNSIFQIVFYSVFGYLFLSVVPGWLGLSQTGVDISMWLIARNVLLFLAAPLVAGALTRFALVRLRGPDWYDGVFARRLAPLSLVALLYTIVVMFISQGDRIAGAPLDVGRIALPLLAYFVLMFSSAFLVARGSGYTYETTAAVAFTAAGNNFELAIAVAIGVFGLASGEAFAAVVGPLIEVPVLLGLVYLSLWLGRKLFAGRAAAAV
jgi:ACR3 family arsenite transporter